MRDTDMSKATPSTHTHTHRKTTHPMGLKEIKRIRWESRTLSNLWGVGKDCLSNGEQPASYLLQSSGSSCFSRKAGENLLIPYSNLWTKEVRNIRVLWKLMCPVNFQRTCRNVTHETRQKHSCMKVWTEFDTVGEIFLQLTDLLLYERNFWSHALQKRYRMKRRM